MLWLCQLLLLPSVTNYGTVFRAFLLIYLVVLDTIIFTGCGSVQAIEIFPTINSTAWAAASKRYPAAASSKNNAAKAKAVQYVTNCGAQTPGKLRHLGGPILKNVQVVPLFWNGAITGNNDDFFGGGSGRVAFADQIEKFYKGITKSTYMDWLSEYCTPAYGKIGRGSSLTARNLTGQPSGDTVDDLNDIQPYLIQLYRNGFLKPNNNTYVAIHFAPGITITAGGSQSCQEFCAYHNLVNLGTFAKPKFMAYGVMPDLGGFFSCFGCSFGPSKFESLTVTSSHELIEAITDPYPSGAVNMNGWYNDPESGGTEIADLCLGDHAYVTDSTNNQWYVGKGWSNKRGICYSP